MYVAARASGPVLLMLLCGGLCFSQGQSRMGVGRTDTLRAPILLAPDSGSAGVSVRPQFRWSGGYGTEFVVLDIAADTLFEDVIEYRLAAGDTTFLPDKVLLNSTHYFWRVGVSSRDSVVRFSTRGDFVTGPSPVSGSIVIPDSRRNETTVAFAVLRNRSGFPIIVDSLSRHPHLRSGTILPAVLPAGDSVVMHYRYRPLEFGSAIDTVVLYTDEGMCTVPLLARCSPPVLLSAVSQVTLGPVAVTDSAASALVFVNGGPLNKLTVRRVWTRTEFFSASFLPVRKLEPGDTLRVPVRFHLRAFRPDAFGSYTDTCFVESDGGLGRVVLRGESPSPRLWIEPPALHFGEVAAYDTTFVVLRVTNRSVNTLRIDSVGNRNRTFRSLVKRVHVGQADTVMLSFRYTPTQFGTHTDTMVLYNNSWWGPVRIPVLGITPHPRLVTGVNRIEFPPVSRGDTAGVVVRITNGSLSRLRIESIQTTTRAFRFTRPALPATLVQGDTLRLPLYFFPDSVRHFRDTLIVVSNAMESPHQIPLNGDGVPPGVSGGRSELPGEFELFQNFPNPFNSTTTFRYALPEPCHVRLEVFTTLGQQVSLLVDGEQDGGFHNVTWAADVTSGVYYYRLLATPRRDPGKRYTGTRKMILMR